MAEMLAMLLLGIVIIFALIRLVYILRIVFTIDFFIGFCLNVVVLSIIAMDGRLNLVLLVGTVVSAFLFNKFIIKQPTIRISNEWGLTCFVFMIGFILLLNLLTDVHILAGIIAGAFLMYTVKQFQLPWFVGMQLCALGLIAANMDEISGLDGLDDVDISTAEASNFDMGLPMETTSSTGMGMIDNSMSSSTIGTFGVDTSTVTQSYSVAPESFYTGSSGDMSGMEETVLPAVGASDTNTYQVSDAGMFPQESVVVGSDGNATIYDNTNVQTGTISHDHMGNSVLKDNFGNTVSYADATGFVYDSNGNPIAHVDSNNGVNTVRDLETGETVVDNRGFMTNENGIVGNITKK